MSGHFLDRFDGWLLLLLTILVLGLATGIGNVCGRKQREVAPDQQSQAGVVLGALLALLSLLLAFTVDTAEDRFTTRRQLVVDEATSIGTTYLRASLLPAPHDAQIQELLRAYVDLRIEPQEPRDLAAAIRGSEALHRALWAQTDAANELQPNSPIVALFAQSLNRTIDVHEERVTVAIYYRLPPGFLWGLYVLSILSVTVMGYTAGLARSRHVALFVFAIVAISLVIGLIIQLDRPWNTIFEVDQRALIDVRRTMWERR